MHILMRRSPHVIGSLDDSSNDLPSADCSFRSTDRTSGLPVKASSVMPALNSILKSEVSNGDLDDGPIPHVVISEFTNVSMVPGKRENL